MTVSEFSDVQQKAAIYAMRLATLATSCVTLSPPNSLCTKTTR